MFESSSINCRISYFKRCKYQSKTQYGDYVIHSASIGGLLPIIQYLIEEQNVDIDIKGYHEQTPLHYASYWNKTDIVKYLVSKGANKNAKAKNGRTPYDMAKNDEIRNILK